MSVDTRTEYIPGDPGLIKDIISQLKSQGVFDQFRKECISDVDTKPAYQNLCHRVDGQVSSYLSDVKWGPDLNKNQLRENIRKYVNECSFVEPGIARIVDQLVNPRINTVLVPKVEDVVYQYIGIPRVERNLSNESLEKSNVDIKSEDESSMDKWTLKRNHENETAWPKSPKRKPEDSSPIRKDSSSIMLSSAKVRTEPQEEWKEKSKQPNLLPSEKTEDDDSRTYSNIDSDEDNLDDVDYGGKKDESSLEMRKVNVEMSVNAESDHFLEASLKCISQSTVQADENLMCVDEVKVDNNTGSCSPDDSHPYQNETKIIVETIHFDVPKTPTINYETSEESDDNNCSNISNTQTEEQRNGSLAYDVPDFSNVDKIAQKIAEENSDQEKSILQEETRSMNGDGDTQKNTFDSTVKSNTEKVDKLRKDHDRDSTNKSTEVNAKDSKHRERKHLEHRKEKHKSDKRDGGRDDRDRRNHREKERSNHDAGKNKTSKSRNESRDKTRKSSDEKDFNDEMSSKSRIKDDYKPHKNHEEHRSRDKDERRHRIGTSSEKRSKDEKAREKRFKSEDVKEERKKNKHDRERSRDSKKSSQDDEKAKYKKAEESETKKSGKSQCGNDEKKARTDRRSSDRDSNGPSSSSNHSHHRSSSKTDKEKHMDKSRHSSSLSSSHKFKKNDGVKSGSADRHSKDNSKFLVTSKFEENSTGHEKHNIGDRIDAIRMDESHCEVEQMLKTIHGHGDADIRTTDDGRKKFSKFPYHKTPVKRTFEETDSEELVSMLNDPLCDGTQSALKICEKNQSNVGIKKPKIARNELEFGKVVKLRKEYKEKMKLLQQQGKENTNYVDESCDRADDKLVLERLSPASTLKEALVSKNVTNGVVKDMRISISRIDSSYTIVNGSCFVNDIGNDYEYGNRLYEAEKSRILSEADSIKSNFKMNSSYVENPDKVFKFKVRHTDSSLNGKERSKKAHNFGSETEDARTDENWRHPAAESRISDTPSENDDELDEDDSTHDEELLRRMNIEEIIGCRTDSTRISYDSVIGSEKVVDTVDSGAAKSHTADKNVSLFDENNEKNVETKSVYLNDSNHNFDVKNNVFDVHYFEPCSPNNDFTKFVEKIATEFENISLPNFSIELNYPKEYDVIFRCQLGATVKRISNAPNVTYDQPNSKNISLEPFEKSSCKAAAETYQRNAESMLSCDFDTTLGNTLKNGKRKIHASRYDQIDSEERKNRITVASKRKTLGIKRKISNNSGRLNLVAKTADVFQHINDERQTLICAESSSVSSTIVDDKNAKRRRKVATSRTPSIDEDSWADHFSENAFPSENLTGDRPCVETKNEEYIRMNPTSCDEVAESCSNSGSAKMSSKKSGRNSLVKPKESHMSHAMVPKRTPYQNKCYYDSSDLYKPRPSFLASSRRSRAFNVDQK